MKQNPDEAPRSTRELRVNPSNLFRDICFLRSRKRIRECKAGIEWHDRATIARCSKQVTQPIFVSTENDSGSKSEEEGTTMMKKMPLQPRHRC